MWSFIILFNLAALVIAAPAIQRDRERRFEETRSRQLIQACTGAAEHPDVPTIVRRARRTTEDVKAEAIYLSWLVKRDALHG